VEEHIMIYGSSQVEFLYCNILLKYFYYYWNWDHIN